MNIYNKEKAKTSNWSFGDLGPLFFWNQKLLHWNASWVQPLPGWNILQLPTTSTHKGPCKWRALKLKLHFVHFMGSPPQPLPKSLNLFRTFQTKARSQGQREIVSSPIGQKKEMEMSAVGEELGLPPTPPLEHGPQLATWLWRHAISGSGPTSSP